MPLILVFKAILKTNTKKVPNRYTNTALFYSIHNWGRLSKGNIIGDQSVHIIMRRLNKGNKMGRITQLSKKPPESLAVDCVKGLCKIKETSIEVNTLFLQLASQEDHISCAESRVETTLGFWKNGW